MHYDNHTVRRQDRLLDSARALDLLREGEYGILSLCEPEGGAYGIPVSYIWDGGEHLYIHCAPEGHKLRCIDAEDRVSLCVVGRTQVAPAQFTTAYESIVVRGRAVRGLPEEERMHALDLLLDKYAPAEKQIGLKYAQKSFHRTEIIRIDSLLMSGKSKQVK